LLNICISFFYFKEDLLEFLFDRFNNETYTITPITKIIFSYGIREGRIESFLSLFYSVLGVFIIFLLGDFNMDIGTLIAFFPFVDIESMW